MKRKRGERMERRRILAELNLMSPRSKGGSRSGRSGCLPFGAGVLFLSLAALVSMGLH